MKRNNTLTACVAIILLLMVGSGSILAAEEKMSADQVAKKLSNPIGSLASLNTSLLYQTFKGDLPNADDQDSWQLQFQPVLPFPLSNGYYVEQPDPFGPEWLFKLTITPVIKNPFLSLF